MVLVDLALPFAIIMLASVLYLNKGQIVFTIKVEQIAAQVQKVDSEISDLQKHYTQEMSVEEEKYYKESVGVLQTLNEILSGNIPDNEEGNK